MLPSRQTSFYYFTCLPEREHIKREKIGKPVFFLIYDSIITFFLIFYPG